MGWKRIVVALFVLLTLSGCATPSKVVPCGPDTYMMSMDDIWGGHSPSKLQILAAEKAGIFCAEQGKKLLIKTTEGSGAWGWTATSSNLIFSCIDENDKETTRP